ncbi:MAG TPA: glycosyltransferase family 2 protein [Flavisolibacter sp.]|nr:glycosyltransferase family 2 protein [Flavisolibacter sp.]
MATEISVVVICKNAGVTIAKTLATALSLSDDVVVMDTGSTDDTIAIAKQFPVRLYESTWLGYGPTKNKAVMLAKYQWILSLDADEWLDAPTVEQIKLLPLHDSNKVYAFRRLNYIGEQPLHYGLWGKDKVLRLYHSQHVKWNDALVHERLTGSHMRICLAKGRIHHFTATDLSSFKRKQMHYAKLMAQRYASQGKRASLIKRYLSPLITFIVNYFIRLGFLDGYYGYLSAKMQAQYTFLKYRFLKKRY